MLYKEDREETREKRTVLFMDDWPLHHTQGIVRKWFESEPWPDLEPFLDPSLPFFSCGYPRIYKFDDQWVMWACGSVHKEDRAGDEDWRLFRYVSSDGLDWKPALSDPNDPLSHCVFTDTYSTHGGHVLYDEHEKDPSRRFKYAYSNISTKPIDDSYGCCRVAVSPDGINWTIDMDAIWRPQHTDCASVIAYNPYTRKYQFISRTIMGDRRISIEQTKDWKTFEDPLVIVHPDPMDPPCSDFYGMPQFFYEGYFLGFLWHEHCGADDFTAGSTRCGGTVSSELTYSINGIQWNRTNRKSFVPDRGLGKGDCLTQYPSCLTVDDEGWMRIYTEGIVGEHDGFPGVDWNEKLSWTSMTVSRWRRDGMCALETNAGPGRILTKCYVPRGGQILLNAITSRFGSIRAELRDIHNKPMPGYELEKSIPVNGDGHFMPLQWKDGDGVRDTMPVGNGKSFRIYFEMQQARLYAMRLNADLNYGFVPLKTMAGEYIPHNIDGWDVEDPSK